MRGGVAEVREVAERRAVDAPAVGPRRAWLALALYVAAIYLLLPYGPRIALPLARTPVGRWLLGPGLATIIGVAAVAMAIVLRRRRAPLRTYLALACAAIGYTVAFSWLRAQHLERTHLPEYGVAAWLAWRAVSPLVPGGVLGYAAAATLGAAIGLGDELLQGIVPGRVYDIRDVAMNAVGAVLGVIVLAAMRAALSAGSSSRRSPPAAGSSRR